MEKWKSRQERFSLQRFVIRLYCSSVHVARVYVWTDDLEGETEKVAHLLLSSLLPEPPTWTRGLWSTARDLQADPPTPVMVASGSIANKRGSSSFCLTVASPYTSEAHLMRAGTRCSGEKSGPRVWSGFVSLGSYDLLADVILNWICSFPFYLSLHF